MPGDMDSVTVTRSLASTPSAFHGIITTGSAGVASPARWAIRDAASARGRRAFPSHTSVAVSTVSPVARLNVPVTRSIRTRSTITVSWTARALERIESTLHRLVTSCVVPELDDERAAVIIRDREVVEAGA